MYVKKRLRLGVDLERLSYDIEREFGEPWLDDGQVSATLSGKNMLLKIGRRTVVFDKYLTMVASAVDTEDPESQIYNDQDSFPYEVSIQRRHLEIMRSEIDRLLKSERVKEAHPENWYRLTFHENSRVN